MVVIHRVVFRENAINKRGTKPHSQVFAVSQGVIESTTMHFFVVFFPPMACFLDSWCFYSTLQVWQFLGCFSIDFYIVKKSLKKKQTALKNTGKKNSPNKVKKLCVKEALKESFPDLCAPGHNTPLSVGSDVIILWVHIYSLSLTLKRDFLF